MQYLTVLRAFIFLAAVQARSLASFCVLHDDPDVDATAQRRAGRVKSRVLQTKDVVAMTTDSASQAELRMAVRIFTATSSQGVWTVYSISTPRSRLCSRPHACDAAKRARWRWPPR
jgi:hypothetical protein